MMKKKKTKKKKKKKKKTKKKKKKQKKKKKKNKPVNVVKLRATVCRLHIWLCSTVVFIRILVELWSANREISQSNYTVARRNVGPICLCVITLCSSRT